MITYNEMYQAQQRYQDLVDETRNRRHNEVIGVRPGTAKRLMRYLKAALNKPAPAQTPVVRRLAGAH